MTITSAFPTKLGNLTFNPFSDRYEITENGITYSLTLEQVSSITDEYQSVSHWYNDLDKYEKVRVWRT